MPRGGVTRKPGIEARVNGADPLARGLVGAWLCQEGAGTRVRDVTGRYHATITTPGTVTWGMGQMGGRALNSASTTATTNGLTLPVPNQTQFALETWLVYTTCDTVDGMLWGNSGSYGLFVRREASTWRLNFYAGSTNLSSNSLPAGRLTQVVLTARGASNIDLYINGRRDTAYTIAPGLIGWTMLLNDPGSETVVGRLELFRLWRRGLGAGEVRDLYRDPFRMFRAGRASPRTTGPAGLSGSVLLTQEGDALQSTATVFLTGQVARSQISATLQSSAFTAPITGQVVRPQGAMTLQASGGLPLTAQAVLTQGGHSVQAASYAVQTATAALTQGGQTALATSSLSAPLLATAALTQRGDTTQATSTVSVARTGTALLVQVSHSAQATGDRLLRLARGIETLAGLAHESPTDPAPWPGTAPALVRELLPLLGATFDPGVVQEVVTTRARALGPTVVDTVRLTPTVTLSLRWRYRGLESLLGAALGYMAPTLPEALGGGVYRHRYELAADLASEPWPAVSPAMRLVRRVTCAVWRQVSVWELRGGMVQTLTLRSDTQMVTGDVALAGAVLGRTSQVNTLATLQALAPCSWPRLTSRQGVLRLGAYTSNPFAPLGSAHTLWYNTLTLEVQNQLVTRYGPRTGKGPDEYARTAPPQVTLTLDVPRYASDAWLETWEAGTPLMATWQCTGPPITLSGQPYQFTVYLPYLVLTDVRPDAVTPGLPAVHYTLVASVPPQPAGGMPAGDQGGPLLVELVTGASDHPLLT